MYTMSQINHIKDLSNCGYRISEISKKTGADPKTIRKYLSQEDFSPVPPVVQTQPSKLDPFKPVIQEWLESAPTRLISLPVLLSPVPRQHALHIRSAHWIRGMDLHRVKGLPLRQPVQ